MFAIRLLSTQVGSYGERLGEIVVGDFREVFACHSDDFVGLENLWRERLQALIEGERTVILRHDPRFAWIAYREGTDCYIQQWLSIDGSFANRQLRETTTEDGDQISEWTTSMASIQQFLTSSASER